MHGEGCYIDRNGTKSEGIYKLNNILGEFEEGVY